jgi:zinc D-Ala-D-Ala dipeptidase
MNEFCQGKMSPTGTSTEEKTHWVNRLLYKIANLGNAAVRLRLYPLFSFLGLFILCADIGCAGALPDGFVYAQDVIPDIRAELRYASNNNFVGAAIAGYQEPRLILTKKAAQALKKAQEDLKKFGLGLKVYDGYRPQQAVLHFVRWAQDLNDAKTKAEYYPDVEKANLFRDGYIAEKSGHSRGSAVDLTIVSLGGGSEEKELDMGTSFDFFGPESWPNHPGLAREQRANRLLLRLLMVKHGFQPHDREWWHFSLKREPFPKTYFDFPVK